MAYMAYMAYIFVFWPTLVVELTTFNTSCYAFATSLFPCQKSGTKSDPLKTCLDQVVTCGPLHSGGKHDRVMHIISFELSA
jgi:hypothetical protein